jgi:O-antigen/teichoic acid export membrane protein
MTGYERDQAKIALLVMIATGILSLILIPTMGGLGAAIATAIGLTLRNLIFTVLVYYHLKIWTLPFMLNKAK